MFDKDTLNGNSQAKALQVLTDVSVTQKRKFADTSDDSSTTETGIENKKPKPCDETDNSIGLSSSEKPAKSLTDGTQKEPDDTIGQARKQLTWAEVLTAAFPKKITEWAKNIFTQLRPWSESNNMKWRMITHAAENPENENTMQQNRKRALPE